MNHVDREDYRQELIREFVADRGEGWSKEAMPGSFFCHELLDRTAMISSLVEQYILIHPACVRNAEWYELAAEAAAKLQELYQRVGAEHLSSDEASEQL